MEPGKGCVNHPSWLVFDSSHRSSPALPGIRTGAIAYVRYRDERNDVELKTGQMHNDTSKTHPPIAPPVSDQDLAKVLGSP